MKRRWIYPNNGGEPFEVTNEYTPEPRGPMVFGDLPSYQSPIDGRWIDGRVARAEDMARNNCRPWEGMAQERKEAARRANYESQAKDQRIERAITSSLSQISEKSRRILLDS